MVWPTLRLYFHTSAKIGFLKDFSKTDQILTKILSFPNFEPFEMHGKLMGNMYYSQKTFCRELFFVIYQDFSLLTKNTARYILVGKCVAQLFESLFFGLFEGSFFIRKRK